MGILKIIRNTDSGLEYMYNALNYVLYGHTDYDKKYSLNTDIDNAYEQFLLVKKYFYKTSGNPVFHFIVIYNARYIDGKMFGGGYAEIYAFLECIKKVTGDKSWIVQYGSDRDKHYEVDENDM